MMRQVTSFCRVCGSACGVRLTIDDNERITAIRNMLSEVRNAWADAASKSQNGSSTPMGVNIAG